MRTRKAWIAVFALALTAAACSKSTPSTGGTTPPAPTTPPVQQTTGGAGSPSCTPNGTQVKEEAEHIAYKESCLAAPADTAFTIEFENRDSATGHNMEIFSDAAMTQSVFKGDIIIGVKTTTYNVSALPAGTYHFHCDVHPTMQGELDVS
jgi:plastocyanin